MSRHSESYHRSGHLEYDHVRKDTTVSQRMRSRDWMWAYLDPDSFIYIVADRDMCIMSHSSKKHQYDSFMNFKDLYREEKARGYFKGEVRAWMVVPSSIRDCAGPHEWPKHTAAFAESLKAIATDSPGFIDFDEECEGVRRGAARLRLRPDWMWAENSKLNWQHVAIGKPTFLPAYKLT